MRKYDVSSDVHSARGNALGREWLHHPAVRESRRGGDRSVLRLPAICIARRAVPTSRGAFQDSAGQRRPEDLLCGGASRSACGGAIRTSHDSPVAAPGCGADALRTSVHIDDRLGRFDYLGSHDLHTALRRSANGRVGVTLPSSARQGGQQLSARACGCLLATVVPCLAHARRGILCIPIAGKGPDALGGSTPAATVPSRRRRVAGLHVEVPHAHAGNPDAMGAPLRDDGPGYASFGRRGSRQGRDSQRRF